MMQWYQLYREMTCNCKWRQHICPRILCMASFAQFYDQFLEFLCKMELTLHMSIQKVYSVWRCVCVCTEMKKCILFIRFYSCTMFCGWNCICVREAKKETERSLICTQQQGWEKAGKRRAINLSCDRFRPADLLVVILLRSQGEKI